jgi:hypothetical protein
MTSPNGGSVMVGPSCVVLRSLCQNAVVHPVHAAGFVLLRLRTSGGCDFLLLENDDDTATCASNGGKLGCHLGVDGVHGVLGRTPWVLFYIVAGLLITAEPFSAPSLA